MFSDSAPVILLMGLAVEVPLAALLYSRYKVWFIP